MTFPALGGCTPRRGVPGGVPWVVCFVATRMAPGRDHRTNADSGVSAFRLHFGRFAEQLNAVSFHLKFAKDDQSCAILRKFEIAKQT